MSARELLAFCRHGFAPLRLRGAFALRKAEPDDAAVAPARTAPLASSLECADAYFLLGIVSECAHASAAAEDHWRRCVYLQPDHHDALYRLAPLAERGGDAPRAQAWRQRAARVFTRRHTGGDAAR